MGGGDTRRKIMRAAQGIVRAGGPGALTFDAVARRLGVSKQAVIYWYPKKEDLVAALALPLLREEAQAALAAMEKADTGAESVAAFVHAVGTFHLDDLDRFRLMYISPQQGGKPRLRMTDALGEQVHALTSSMYDALQEQVAEARGLSADEARRAAVAIHTAVLGLATVVSMTQAMGDPLRHDPRHLLDSMAHLLSR